jgi:hypothetical protein
MPYHSKGALESDTLLDLQKKPISLISNEQMLSEKLSDMLGRGTSNTLSHMTSCIRYPMAMATRGKLWLNDTNR